MGTDQAGKKATKKTTGHIGASGFLFRDHAAHLRLTHTWHCSALTLKGEHRFSKWWTWVSWLTLHSRELGTRKFLTSFFKSVMELEVRVPTVKLGEYPTTLTYVDMAKPTDVDMTLVSNMFDSYKSWNYTLMLLSRGVGNWEIPLLQLENLYLQSQKLLLWSITQPLHLLGQDKNGNHADKCSSKSFTSNMWLFKWCLHSHCLHVVRTKVWSTRPFGIYIYNSFWWAT